MQNDKLKFKVFFLIIIFCGVFGVVIDSWAEIIPAERRTIWQGNVGVEGGIPDRTTIYQTFSPGATSAQINAAIASCPAGQVVYLSAGTYNLTDEIDINKSNVTLRGAGPTQTILRIAGGYGSITFEGAGYIETVDPAKIVNWTAGYNQGTTQITLSSIPASLTVGMLIVLDQVNDPNLVNPNGNEGLCAYCAIPRNETGLRVQQQTVIVKNINGNTVTISPGIMMPNWDSSLSPQAWWDGGAVHDSGIENLKIDNSATPTDNTEYNFFFHWTYNCWVKNVESAVAHAAHVRMYYSARNEIRDSYFHETKNYASESYGTYLDHDAGILIENNIWDTITSPLLAKDATVGYVFGYNYCINMRYDPSPAWLIASQSTHGSHTSMLLYEGNIGTQMNFDFIHGSSSHNTLFRNRLFGWQTDRTDNTTAVIVNAWNRDINIVGNVLGQSGFHTTYQYNSSVSTCSDNSRIIYSLGYYGSCGSGASFDSETVSSLLRHGNYDYVSNATIWDSGITDHDIPDSLYLSSKPAWWGVGSWPSIGPDLNPMTGFIPAEARYSGASDITPPSAPDGLAVS